MAPEQLEILNQLVRESKVFMLLGGLALFASAAAGAYIAGYFAKRVEMRAIKAEVETVITQNRQILDAVEAVATQNRQITDAVEAARSMKEAHERDSKWRQSSLRY